MVPNLWAGAPGLAWRSWYPGLALACCVPRPHAPLMRLNLLPGTHCQDAVRTLNTLQTNANYLEMVKRERGDPQTQLEAMKLYLARSGLQVRWGGPVTTSTPHFCMCILWLRQGPCLSVLGGGLGPTEHHPHHWDQGEGESQDPGVGRPRAGEGVWDLPRQDLFFAGLHMCLH